MDSLLNRRVTHRHNPDLGPGRIVAVGARTLEVEFPASGTRLELSHGSDALVPVEFVPGMRVSVETDGRSTRVVEVTEDGVRLDDGTVVPETELWPVDPGDSPFDRLGRGDVDSLEDLSIRMESVHLESIREARGLGSFLGGRIRLFPHQLYVAERATRADPVRWLLADEVGLGKTVEACLILNRLARTGRATRTLVIAPETLTVQWLGELWRKYHQVFVLVDEARLADVEREYGEGFNPFDAYPSAIVGLDFLIERPWLTERAAAAPPDLVIVDEAHHLRRPPGHPGDPAYRAVAPIARAAPHALLLSATPLEDDAHGFFRLLQLLRTDTFPEELDFAERLATGEPLPPCTSATRRADIGGLPPRQASPVDLVDAADSPGAQLEERLLAEPAGNPAAAKRKADRIARAASSGVALEEVLDRKERRGPLRRLARQATERDARLEWLARAGARFKANGDKTLVFVRGRETLEWLRAELSRRAQIGTGVFHEDLSPQRRDIEVAQFRLPTGPSMLISTECGGEGRNFEFCTRLVLFDLPWDPVVVEQRIGRLDRIGRDRPVEIVYFRPTAGIGRTVAELYEKLGLFREPLGGIERELAAVSPAIERAVAAGHATLPADEVDRLVSASREARDRVRDAAYRTLHQEPYRSELADAILARVPEDLEETTEDVVVAALERWSVHVERQRGTATFGVEFGNRALVESLPGVPGGTRFLGTFDRVEALEREDLDFFASGHPLVEGVLAYLADAPFGRVGLVHLADVDGDAPPFGVAAAYRRGDDVEVIALGPDGKPHGAVAARLLERPFRSKRVRADDWTRQAGWAELVAAVARHFESRGRPEWVVAFRADARA